MWTQNMWIQDATVYHLYPLGCLDAPARNPFTRDAGTDSPDRIAQLYAWLPYLQELGINTLLLGPVQQSSAHGYDVADYFLVDRRLGTNEALQNFSRDLHGRGMRLVLDAVFHHTGRDFWAFKDVQARGEASPYRDWYHLDFARRSPFGDPFHYEGWAGHYDLVKLNLRNVEVREHLFAAAASWIEQFDVDGLRLDAADRLDPEFRRDLAAHCRALKPEFWLMGEVVHGDYRQWAHPGGLDATTNYELYKGLWSAHNDRNYFELAYSLDRQSGAAGMYRELNLFTFADNHDVDRVASTLREPGHLHPLYILLMTMPGVPSLYYGSEWGLRGRRSAGSDAELRPAATPAMLRERAPYPDLYRTIQKLLQLRCRYAALRTGVYTPLHIAHEQFAFSRSEGRGAVIVAVNASAREARIRVELRGVGEGRLTDVLNQGCSFAVAGGSAELPLDPHWGRVLLLET